MTEAQALLETTRGELDALKTGKAESDSTASQAQEELADYRLWERKLAAVRAQAPELLPLEKSIVVELPAELENTDPATMQEEQLKVLDTAIAEAIKEFGEAMAGYVKGVQAAEHVGVVPVSSPGRGSDSLSLEQLYDLAIEKAGTPEGDAIMAQYTKLAGKDESLGTFDSVKGWRPPNASLLE